MSQHSVREIKKLIWEYIAAQSGIDQLPDAGLQIINIRVNKLRAVADIIQIDYSNNSSSRKNKQVFSIETLEHFHEKRVL